MPHILEPKVKSLLARNRIEEASQIVEDAQLYHAFGDVATISSINDLRGIVNGVDNIQILQSHFHSIFSSEPSKLVKIFPPNTNNKDSLIEFVVNEIALATSKMLDKILSIEAIKDENRYSDLLVLALESRISLWGWSVPEQLRKGISPQGQDLGEIDFDIKDFRKKAITTCEAFIFRTETKTCEHIEKLFTKYTHDIANLILIVYYIGDKTNFDKKWKEYHTKLISKLTLPTGFEIGAQGVEDVSSEYNLKNSGVRIGKSSHGSTTTLYHIYINTSYTK